jgi:hypothetical protein
MFAFQQLWTRVTSSRRNFHPKQNIEKVVLLIHLHPSTATAAYIILRYMGVPGNMFSFFSKKTAPAKENKKKERKKKKA